MHDAGKIFAGLAVFLGFVTTPLWYGSVQGAEPEPLQLPATQPGQKCVAPTDYMRALHMDLLDDWRDEAVRDGERTYIGQNGEDYEKSLTSTCISQCHTSREQFCDRCHDHVGAKPFCWGCHTQPKVAH